jgi:thiol-disulfide isomerase/thioredoxin
MKQLAFILILTTTISFGQSTAKYDWDYVIERVKKNKMDVTVTTKEIISEIAATYDGQSEQKELIKFYGDAYDFKTVDKSILKSMIDSLYTYGLNEDIKALAVATRNSMEFRLLNKRIMDIKLPDKDGNEIVLMSLKEKIVIIELWATWCGPCIKEMQRIPDLKKTNPNIEFYSISVDKSPDKMKKFVEKNSYEWPIVFGGDEQGNKDLWEYFNIVAIPKYYTIDRDGIVINVADKLDEQFIKDLK